MLAAALTLLALGAHSSCPAADRLKPGPTPGAYYATVAPFEHFSSARTAVFPSTCALRRGQRVTARQAPGDYRTPYIAATRGRRQLYVYGYRPDAAGHGAYVALVDTATLRERWRTRILDQSPPAGWSYPGVLAVHGNGYLYAVYGNVMVKLDPATGSTLARRKLPEDPGGTGAAYNGLIVLPDGRIATKKIERGPCPAALQPPAEPATSGALAGLSCAAANALPSRIVVLDPRRLRVRSNTVPPEPITGRITAGTHAGRTYVYAAGRDRLMRFRYRRGSLSLDRGWGPVTYRTGAERPGTGPGLLGPWVVVQTNFLPASAPMTVTAVSVRDSRRVFRIRPFADAGTNSWIVSKAALDAANRTIVTHDTAAGRMAALRLGGPHGIAVRWRRRVGSLAFAALVGPAARRQVVIPDLTDAGDEVAWIDEGTGADVTRTRPLAPTAAPGNIVTPGFGGRFYYLSGAGALWELTPRG